MSIRPRTILTGALSFVPGIMPLYRWAAFRPNAAPASNSYGIWLKHFLLSMPHRARAVPRNVIEIGPGASLGAGLAALICGVERYTALDAVRFVEWPRMLSVFDSLVELFSSRVRPENASGFPAYLDRLDESGFPSDALSVQYMKDMLQPSRIAGLRSDVARFVASGGRESDRLAYFAPWRPDDVPRGGDADFLFSHTVLQHADAPAEIWRHMGSMLCEGGVCSHQVNFDSHGVSAVWNGHWACPRTLWRLALGRKTFLINREPLSRHHAMAAAAGLTIVDTKCARDHTGIARALLAQEWQFLDDADLATRGAFMIARRDAKPLFRLQA